MADVPQMIHVPDTKEQVSQLLAQNPLHPGLKAAHSSLENNRHPRIASLILLGVTGAGKSSTVNSLFNCEIADTGSGCSISKEITEFEIKVPMPDIGVSNGVLRIVDTPGFGDTSSSTLDAQLLASLHKYFDKNYDHSLTCLLFVGKFDDERYDGPNSEFVRMMKAVESLMEKQKALEGASVACVLTRFMNGTRAEKKDPSTKINDIRRVIREHTRFTEPIILVAENRAEDRDIDKSENGFYKLPNGDYYPYNIFQGIKSLIGNIDPMGESIIRTVYKSIADWGKPTKNVIKLVEENDGAVLECGQVLEQISKPVAATEVSQRLAESWQQLGMTDPAFLRCLQMTFQRKSIQRVDQLPQNPKDIMLLIQDLPKEHDLAPILASAFGIQVPKLHINTVTGCSYNILNDSAMAHSIFDTTTNFTLSPLGFSIPSHLIAYKHTERRDRCEFFASQEEFMMARLQELQILVSGGWKAFCGRANFGHKTGYNLTTSSSTQSFSATREFRDFSLWLRKDTPKTKEFVENVTKLLPFDPNDKSSVAQYQNFFSLHGTHVVSTCFGGGQLEVIAKRSNQSTSRHSLDHKTIQAGLSFAIMKCFDVGGGLTLQSSEAYTKLLENFMISVTLRGGSHLNNCQLDAKTVLNQGGGGGGGEGQLTMWQQSLIENPMMLHTAMELKPISHFVGQVRENIQKDVEAAAEKLFSTGLDIQNIFVGPPPRELEPTPQEAPFSMAEGYGRILGGTGQVALGYVYTPVRYTGAFFKGIFTWSLKKEMGQASKELTKMISDGADKIVSGFKKLFS